MMQKRSRFGIWIMFCGICVILLLLNYTGNPFLRLDKEFAGENALHGTVEHTVVGILDQKKAEIVDVCGEIAVDWIPSPDFGGPPYFSNKQELYISIVFQNQMFLHIFVLDDDSIVSYINPWNNRNGIYYVKNPEVLREAINIMTGIGRDSGIIKQ